MRLSAEQAGELLATSTARSKDFDRSPNGIVAVAVDQLKKDYAELLATLPSEAQWATAVASWVRLNVPMNHSGQVVSDVFTAGFYLETALLTLLDNQTLVPVIITAESEQDIENLRKSVRAYRRVLFNEVDSAPEPTTITFEPAVEPPAPDPVDQCASDFKTLASSEFRAKWMTPSNRPVFDDAVNRGLV